MFRILSKRRCCLLGVGALGLLRGTPFLHHHSQCLLGGLAGLSPSHAPKSLPTT